MKKLSDMLREAKQIEKDGFPYDPDNGHNYPIFGGFTEFFYVFSKALESFKTGKEATDVPKEIEMLVSCAYSWGASTALRTLAHGLIVRDAKGKAIDSVQYSLEELLNESENMQDPTNNRESLEADMEFVKKFDDDEEYTLFSSEEDTEEEDEDERPVHLH